jgi:hypothetical protein
MELSDYSPLSTILRTFLHFHLPGSTCYLREPLDFLSGSLPCPFSSRLIGAQGPLFGRIRLWGVQQIHRQDYHAYREVFPIRHLDAPRVLRWSFALEQSSTY